MSNENKDLNMNIPSNQPGQPQSNPTQQAPAQPEQPKRPASTTHTTQMHTQPHNKMVFLIMVTLVFGIISVVSLLFALRMKNESPTPTSQEESTETVTEVAEEIPSVESGQFDPKAKILELNKLNLEMIEEAYLDSTLEE